ncbi:MAG TPA: hypothetical protein VNU97_15115 [Rhizomicrobium sp.]|nr:hypothetical protein [Rhizomicrobium sp.]
MTKYFAAAAAFAILGTCGTASAQPAPEIPVGNHYACYPVRQEGDFRPVTAVFTDQFGHFGAVVTGITRLCNPATKLMDGRPYKMVDANLHLTCYAIRPVDFGRRTVRTTDQFGTRELLVAPPTEVCLPAAKTLLK